MRRLLIGVSRRVEYDLRGDYFEHLQTLSSSFYQRWRTGDLMSRAANDIGAVRMVVGPGIMYPAETLIVLIGALGFMFAISWKLTLIALAVLPLVSYAVKKFGSAIHKRFMAIQEKMSDILGANAGKFVRNTRRESLCAGGPSAETVCGRERRLFRAHHGARKDRRSFQSSARLAHWNRDRARSLWGGAMVVGEEITLGELVAFFAYLNLLSWPMIALGWVVNIYQRGAASMKRLTAVLDEEPVLRDGPERFEAPVSGGIEFRDVSFSYTGNGNGARVLRDIDLVIEPGQTVAFVGRTGSGKSTLTRLVARLYDVTDGAILVDGHDVRRLSLKALRSAVGFVPQGKFSLLRKCRREHRFRPRRSER